MSDSFISATCACTTQQYDPVVFNNVAYQAGANSVYESLNATVNAATAGTLGSAATGQPIFKTNAERMQYLLGRQNRASCGVPKKTFYSY
jgi:hypothetical protein